MFEVMIERYFSAAHRLLNYEGLCENLHGHNWKVQVYIQGDQLDEAGILVDFKILKSHLDTVLDELDHRDVNELDSFEGISPSSEFIAKYIYCQLKVNLPGICKVSVWETENTRASYWE